MKSTIDDIESTRFNVLQYILRDLSNCQMSKKKCFFADKDNKILTKFAYFFISIVLYGFIILDSSMLIVVDRGAKKH